MTVYYKIVNEFREWEKSWSYVDWSCSTKRINYEEFVEYLNSKYDITERSECEAGDSELNSK